jgi:transcriptional regulator with XRE-family HTH domain
MKKTSTSIRLNQIMNERGLKQVDVLRLTEPLCKKYDERLGKNDLSQYVSGKTEPGQRKLFILGKALGVNPSWLLGLDVPKEETAAGKKNDAIADIILRLRTDNNYLEVVQSIGELSPEQLSAVKSFLSAFNNKM